MTTTQTIDGVPRELIEKAMLACFEAGFGIPHAELRALLDAPAEPKPTGLSQGWNLTRKHDGFVVGHQSLAYPPDEKAIERAERDGYVWVPFLVPSAQPKGEPVARWVDKFDTEYRLCPVVGNLQIQIREAGRPDRWADVSMTPAHALTQLSPLYAEQPAPVAVALPDRDTLRDLIAQAIGGDTYDCTRVWSAWSVGTMSSDDFVPVVDQEARLYEITDACLEEFTRLNAQ